MRRAFLFAKRNFKEMLRDPLIYVFCLGFPLVMIVLFQCIVRFAGQGAGLSVFSLPSLIPGIMMFSFSFVMLMESLLISKDRTTAFLIRLYTSPMKPWEFVAGYVFPAVCIGIVQEIVCLSCGLVCAAITGEAYFSFGAAVLLALVMLPVLLTMIFLGVFFGTVLNDKSAPGVSSVIISVAGILGGAWMPLDMMGDFETFCRFLPFYPSVYIGRIMTGASHSPDLLTGISEKYVWDATALFGLISIAVFLCVSIFLAVFAFAKGRDTDKR